MPCSEFNFKWGNWIIFNANYIYICADDFTFLWAGRSRSCQPTSTGVGVKTPLLGVNNLRLWVPHLGRFSRTAICLVPWYWLYYVIKTMSWRVNESSFLFNPLSFEYEKDGKIVCLKMSSYKLPRYCVVRFVVGVWSDPRHTYNDFRQCTRITPVVEARINKTNYSM